MPALVCAPDARGVWIDTPRTPTIYQELGPARSLSEEKGSRFDPGSGALVVFAPFALSLPSSLVSFDWCRFASGRLGTLVEIAKPDVRLVPRDARPSRF